MFPLYHISNLKTEKRLMDLFTVKILVYWKSRKVKTNYTECFHYVKEYFSYFFHHPFLKSKLSLMANFGNVAVSQKYNVHEVIAHFSPILDKKISGPFRYYFFLSQGLILMKNVLKYQL